MLYQGYTGGEMVFAKGAGVKPMDRFFESEEESGSGHHHHYEKNNEPKNEMHHNSTKDTIKTQTEHKLNPEKNMHPHAKNSLRTKKKELKDMKY